MSPIFKRNRKNLANTPAPEAPVTLEAEEAVELETPALPEEQEPREAQEPAAEDPQDQPAEAHAPTRMERMSRAYAAWHAELTEVAEAAEQPASPANPATVDLTQPHPTGASTLYSGRPTLLSSLVREESALQRAHQRLTALRARIDVLAERYGYAPVTLAIGRMVWTELPEVSPADLGSTYADTGELKLSTDTGEVVTAGPLESADDSATAAASVPDANASAPDAAEGADGSPDADSASGAQTDAAGAQTDAAGAAPAVEPAREVREMSEPALLRTARLESVGTDDAYITLTSRSEINPVVLRALRQHGIRAEEISKLRALAADASREAEAIARLRELGRAYLPGFTFHDTALLGNFVHPGQVLVSDLEAMKPYIETSGIMAALAGDADTARLSSAALPPASREDRAPEVERGAGDRDPAELAVVEAVASGRSIVVDTPPGSDAVGTLASIVADAAASGRSVLYVPGRASGARALQDELERLGLGELVLDFSDLDSVARRIRTGLRLRAEDSDADEVLALRTRLTEARRELRSYVGAVHEVDSRWKVSLADVLERLAELTSSPNPPRSRVRLDAETLDMLLANREAIEEQAREAASLGAFATAEESPWSGADVRDRETGAKALARAERLASETMPVVIAQSQRAAGETGLAPAETFDSWMEQIEMLTGISHSLDIFLPQIFERSAQDMVIATASKEWRAENEEPMKGSERRRLTKQARDMVRPGATTENLHEDLATVQRQREVWRRHTTEGGWPKLPDGMAQIRATADEARSEIEALEERLPGVNLRSMPLGQMLEKLKALAADKDTMARLPRANELKDALRSQGMGALLDDFSGRGITPEAIAGELDLVTASSEFEQLVAKSPELATTTPDQLYSLAAEVRELDAAHVGTLAGPVGRAVVRIMRETIGKRREDAMRLDAQLQRYGTGGLREAIATFPRLVQVARPVWVIPSMMVAEFVPPMPWADVVIMDDQDSASVAPAVSMLMRGRQIVVVGDTRRVAIEESGAAIADFAKVLPVCELPTLRAQHDHLAAETLRDQGYGDVLTMVPEASRGRKPRVLVVDGRGVPNRATGMIEGTQAEVDAVVDAVVEHALSRPEQSLAVVSVSAVHAARIRESLKKLAVTSNELAAFLAGNGREPFAVIELTQAGGLRRDCVILTLGFGKTVHGRVLHTFGTLTTAAGLTGLVDTVEAARSELTLISCIGPGELGADKVAAPGPRMFERLVDRASGNDILSQPLAGTPGSALIADLAQRLRDSGCEVACDFGYGDGVRIPLVVGSVDLPGTWRVAVLLDDADYVAEPSLRRRDRYWLERLEQRGWTVVRTFTTSLFIDPNAEAKRIAAVMAQVHGDEVENTVAVPHIDDAALGGVGASMSVVAASAADADAAVGGRATSGDRPAGRLAEYRPDVTPGLPLAAYTDDQLDDLVEWIASDGVERSRPELMDALRQELAIDRRGAQFDAILGNVVDRSGLAVSLNLESEGPTLGDGLRGPVPGE